jgi:predicted permease
VPFNSFHKKFFTGLHLWLIWLIGVIVPRRLRADWRQEWEAELRHRERLLAQWDRLDWRNKLELLRRGLSAFWDALCLQPERWEDEMIQDLRFGVRMLLKNKGFTAAAALSLALGIGANTAIFSLIDAALLKTLPVKDPRRLARFTVAGPRGVSDRFNYPLIEQFKQNNSSFTDIITTSSTARWRMAMPEANGESEVAQITRVSGNFFSALGVDAVAGRTLTEDDDSAAGPQPVAVISHNLWKRRFGLDPGVVGRKIMLDNFPFTVVGVAPEGFFGFEVGDNPDAWFPIRMTPLLPSGNQILTLRDAWVLRVMARLKPGLSLEQASSEMDVVLQRHINEIAPERAAGFTSAQRRNYFERRIILESGATGVAPLRRTITLPLLVLMAIVCLVLLISCANVATLLLARSAARRKEIAVRLSLGAGRFRLVRQLLTESALLAALSGALGLLFARWGARLLLTYLPRQSADALNISIDARALGFTLAVSLLAGLLFGVIPALRATRLDLSSSLNDAAAGSPGRSRQALRKILVVAQVALSLCLLVGAGLFVRSLQKLKSLDAGFDRENVMLFELDSMAGYSPARRVSFQKQLFEKLESLPGARAASRSQSSLLSGLVTIAHIEIEGYAQKPDEDLACHQLSVGPRYFTTMGIPLLQGRDFNSQELQPAPGAPGAQTAQSQPGAAQGVSLAAVINQTMAREFFGGQSPLGRHFRLQDWPLKGIPVEIVGVAKDAKYATLREQTPRAFYLSSFQWPGDGGGTYLLRTLDAPSSAAAGIQRAAHELDPQAQTMNFRTMNDVVDESLVQERFVAQLGGFFSLCALLFACVGLYGVTSYATARRTQEIGIRMALGARRTDVLWLVMRETLLMTGIGIVIGLGAALAATRLVMSLLFDLSPADPVTITLAALLMLVVALIACYLPARRATTIDPLATLRHD